ECRARAQAAATARTRPLQPTLRVRSKCAPPFGRLRSCADVYWVGRFCANGRTMNNTKTRRNVRIGIALIATLAALGACQSVFDNPAADSGAAANQGGTRVVAP